MERLYEKLEAYSQSDHYGFHMPGHKRKALFPHCFEIDITEIDGFDDLHHPEGLLKEFQDYMSQLYGSSASYMMVNGSTGGILAAISAVTELGGELVAARNCHKSVYNVAYLRNLHVHYVYPQLDEKWGFFSSVSPSDVDNCLRQHPSCKAVIIVSPTYEGIVSDVRAIVKVVHRHGAILIVDEAHGAHFSFLSRTKEEMVSEKKGLDNRFSEMTFPESAVACGADIVIQSVHKTLPSLTQTAVLHVCGNQELQKKIAYYLSVYESSSPSYVLMSSIQESIVWMEENRETGGRRYCENLLCFRKKIHKLKWIELYQPKEESVEKQGDQWKTDPYALYDCGKLVLRVKGMANSGQWLYRILLERYQIQFEMCQPGYCIAMTSVMDDQMAFARLESALAELDQMLEHLWSKGACKKEYVPQLKDFMKPEKPEMQSVIDMELAQPEIRYTAYEADHMEKEVVRLEDCVGRISGETAYVYPPGIPLIVQGEVLTEECVETLLQYRGYGFEIRGIRDVLAEKIDVIKGRQKSHRQS